MLFMAVIAQRMEFEKPVSAPVASAATWHQIALTSGVCCINTHTCAAAELWFGGDDDMVTWEPSLKPWLVE